jgi:undecaprenyl-phosphate 4-deoxy-4-formamido-L-arabinose transferase
MYVGMAAAAAGFFALIAVVIRRLINTEVASGWTSTIGVLLIMSGLLMLGLGIVGEYIGRIYMCINGTPQYLYGTAQILYKNLHRKRKRKTLDGNRNLWNYHFGATAYRVYAGRWL